MGGQQVELGGGPKPGVSLFFLSRAAVDHSWPVAALLWPHT